MRGSEMKKHYSDTAVSGTTGGESSAPSKETPVAKRSLLPASIRTCPYCRRLGSAAHIMRCGQEIVSCPDCGVGVEAAKLGAHAAYTCSKRTKTTPCLGCGASFSPFDMREHLMNACPGSRFLCAGCGQTFLTATEYVTHLYSPEEGCRVVTPEAKRGEELPFPIETKEANGKASSGRGSAGNEIMMKVGQGKAPLIVQPPMQLGCPVGASAEPRSLNAVEVEVDEHESNSMRRASETVTPMPRQNLSKFLRQREVSPHRCGKSLDDGRNVQGARLSPAVGTSGHSLSRDREHLNSKQTPTSVPGGHFHARSRRFMKELQDQHDTMTKARQMYYHTVVASAPRLATAELRARRIEKEKPRAVTPYTALHAMQQPKKSDGLLRHGMARGIRGASAHQPPRRHASCPPGRRLSTTLMPAKKS
ncbi:hypothetical protein TCSYLVIO_002949 [Trypanosoma cruzi]|nr:hypothetical protein TCSYLVIO_002949 [Trypanosoma cruzi]PBJ68453.1 hypothetical protein BCY84_21637 [Trypanosoma cruzi cruzi]RNF23425.1 hypothetical protein TcG_01418 [Trypanosoma cruzi]